MLLSSSAAAFSPFSAWNSICATRSSDTWRLLQTAMNSTPRSVSLIVVALPGLVPMICFFHSGGSSGSRTRPRSRTVTSMTPFASPRVMSHPVTRARISLASRLRRPMIDLRSRSGTTKITCWSRYSSADGFGPPSFIIRRTASCVDLFCSERARAPSAWFQAIWARMKSRKWSRVTPDWARIWLSWLTDRLLDCAKR